MSKKGQRSGKLLTRNKELKSEIPDDLKKSNKWNQVRRLISKQK